MKLEDDYRVGDIVLSPTIKAVVEILKIKEHQYFYRILFSYDPEDYLHLTWFIRGSKAYDEGIILPDKEAVNILFT